MAESELTVTPRRRPGRHLAGVPVFVYHGLTTAPLIEVPARERKYWVSATTFRAHLDEIRRAGVRSVLLRELWHPAVTPGETPTEVALTFDDGRASDYQLAYPTLLEAGARADFFLNTVTVGQPGFVDWIQVGEMQRAGMAFQSHAHDHVDLTRLPHRQLEWQLTESKRQLEDHLVCAVEFLAVPYGSVNRRVVEVARQLGYRAVCTSRTWPARPGARTVNRTVVYGHTSAVDFTRLLVGEATPYLRRTARALLLAPARAALSRSRRWLAPPAEQAKSPA